MFDVEIMFLNFEFCVTTANVNKNIDMSGNHQGTLNRKNSIQNEMAIVHEGTLRKSYWNSPKNLTVFSYSYTCNWADKQHRRPHQSAD